MKGPTEIKKKTVLALGIIYILNVTFFFFFESSLSVSFGVLIP